MVAQRSLISFLAFILIACSPGTAHAVNVGPRGGPGGGNFEIRCDPQDFLVGFDVWATQTINGLAPVCGVHGTKGTTGRPIMGTQMGTRHNVRCQPGAVLTILHVFWDPDWKPPLVNRLGFTCWNIGTNEMTNNLPDYGGMQKLNERLSCPIGQVAIGIFGKAGTSIDSLGVICDKWPLTAGPVAGPVPPTCGPNVGDPVPAEWADMLNAHNSRRKLHCACPLSWSKPLASDSFNYATQCILDKHGISGGENMADAWQVSGSPGNFTPVLPAESNTEAFEKTWYCEHNNYDFKDPKFVGGFTKNCGAGNNPKVNGHFTQVVWKDTRQVGCAKATCTMTGDVTDKNGIVIAKNVTTQGTHWVCRYLPAGNSPTDSATLKSEVSDALCR